MDTIKILGISGSLRHGSYNTALLKAAQESLPPGVTLDIFDLNGLPVFSEDLEANVPPQVNDLKKRIRAADAILFATPEYNYSIPGSLKNAIDWASRPYGDSAWMGKPAAIMGASVGRFGTARAQYHLRQVFVYLDMHVVNQPEVMVGNASESFDQSGRLTHDTSRKLIRQLVEALCDRVRLLRQGVKAS
ncbi:MAG TPA: NAD(P)H-dependent oxidoreductase [Methylomirabilota bacterium]|nr:NAD(P)H-dependent oxidoreductase [Methylomirabilota bacterium]